MDGVVIPWIGCIRPACRAWVPELSMPLRCERDAWGNVSTVPARNKLVYTVVRHQKARLFLVVAVGCLSTHARKKGKKGANALCRLATQERLDRCRERRERDATADDGPRARVTREDTARDEPGEDVVPNIVARAVLPDNLSQRRGENRRTE